MSWFKRAIPAAKRSATDVRVTLVRACQPVIERLEPRMFLSYGAEMSGLPTATVNTSYTAYVDSTGSTATSSETFHWTGADTGPISVRSTRNPKATPIRAREPNP